jgi:hypothetical protein
VKIAQAKKRSLIRTRNPIMTNRKNGLWAYRDCLGRRVTNIEDVDEYRDRLTIFLDD